MTESKTHLISSIDNKKLVGSSTECKLSLMNSHFKNDNEIQKRLNFEPDMIKSSEGLNRYNEFQMVESQKGEQEEFENNLVVKDYSTIIQKTKASPDTKQIMLEQSRSIRMLQT